MSAKNKTSTSGPAKKSYQVPWFIRAAIKILEAISTGLATQFALRLFFTPLNFKRPERELPVYDQAVKHRLMAGNSPFTACEWGEKGSPRVILVHGWSGRGTQFFKIIESLIEKGFHVIAIDAPAHGGAKQKRTHLFEFVSAIEITVEHFGQFKYAIGHSLGGTAIFNAMLRNLKAEKVVTIGTPDNIPNVISDFCEKVGASDKIGKRIEKYIENRYSMKTSDASTDELASRINPEGLIIHDLEDQDVSAENAKALAQKWPNATLLITEGLGHRKILMDEKVIDTIIGFLPIS